MAKANQKAALPAENTEEQNSTPVAENPAPLEPTGTQAEEVPLPAGHVLLAALDGEGNETEIFTVAEKGYARYYSDESKYRLKKKAN